MKSLPGFRCGPCVLFLLSATLALHAGKGFGQDLQQLRSEVRIKDPSLSDRPERDRDDDHCHDEYDSCDDGYSLDEVGAIGYLTGIVATAPYWVPITAVNDSPSRRGYFPAFPYQHDVGYMLIDPPNVGATTGPRIPFNWAVRARTDYGTNFSGLDWLGGNLLLEATPRIGIESDLRFYQEELPAIALDAVDTAWLGDTNVFIRFAQSEWLQMRSGIGVAYLSDREQTDVGFNFTYAGDYYPLKPWVISGEFDWGLLGDEQLLHVRLTTGVQYRGLEAYVGYDLIDIGQFQSNSLIGGVRLWF